MLLILGKELLFWVRFRLMFCHFPFCFSGSFYAQLMQSGINRALNVVNGIENGAEPFYVPLKRKKSLGNSSMTFTICSTIDMSQ